VNFPHTFLLPSKRLREGPTVFQVLSTHLDSTDYMFFHKPQTNFHCTIAGGAFAVFAHVTYSSSAIIQTKLIHLCMKEVDGKRSEQHTSIWPGLTKKQAS
jgi:hypothetical protein